MASPSLLEILDAIEAALQPVVTEVEGLQVYPFMNVNPTPPSIDVYPADPFQTGEGMSRDERTSAFTIRARANVADLESGQRVLLQLLDTTDAASVENALLWNGFPYTARMADGYPTGFRAYTDSPGELIGVEWRIEVFT